MKHGGRGEIKYGNRTKQLYFYFYRDRPGKKKKYSPFLYLDLLIFLTSFFSHFHFFGNFSGTRSFAVYLFVLENESALGKLNR